MNNEQLLTAYHEACHAIFVLINEKNNFNFEKIKNNKTIYYVPYENKTTITFPEFEITAKICLAGELGSFFFFNDELKMIVQEEACGLTDFKKILKLYQFVKNDFGYEITSANIAYLQAFVPDILQTLYYYREEIRLLVHTYFQNNNYVSREDAFYIMEHKTLPERFKIKQKQLCNWQNLLTEEQLAKNILNSDLFTITEVFKMEIVKINTKLQCEENSSEVHKNLVKIVIINHDIKEMKKFLQANNNDCNIKNKNGDSLFMLAIESEATDIATALFEYDIDINIQNNDGETALHWAALNDHYGIMALLLERVEINVNLQNKMGETALHFTALGDNNFLPMAFLLAHDKIDVNLQTKNSATALHFAAFNNHIDALILLLEHGKINLNHCTHSGNTALHFAALKGHVKIIKTLLKYKNIVTNIKNENGETPLCLAAINGYSEIVDLLLKHDENISHNNENIINFFVMLKQEKYDIKPEIINLINESFERIENLVNVRLFFTAKEKLLINNDDWPIATRQVKAQVKQPPLNTEMNWDLFVATDKIPQTIALPTTALETPFWPSFADKDKKALFPEQINVITTQQQANNHFFPQTRSHSI